MVLSVSSNGGFNLVDLIGTARRTQDDLQRQLATGERADTYGGIGNQRHQLISFTGEMSQIEGYTRSIDHMINAVDVMGVVLGQISDMASVTRTDSFYRGFEPDNDGLTLYQKEAGNRFHETASLLNTDYAGRHLFGGRVVSSPPINQSDDILHGKNGAAGFIQTRDERLLADKGANGLGRLDLTAPTPTSVSLVEDGAHPFGLKLTNLSHNFSGVSATGPTGALGQIDLDLTASTLSDGQSLTLSVTLPDGEVIDVSLTAQLTAPQDVDAFQIGATPLETAKNLKDGLEDLLGFVTDTDLSAASQVEAGKGFFGVGDGAPPLRVDGPPFETATALKNGTADDTISWYLGESGTDSARKTSQILADDSRTIEFGARGNEEAFRKNLTAFAVLGTTQFDVSSPHASQAYDALKLKMADLLSGQNNGQTVDHIKAELGSAQASGNGVKERHQSSYELLQKFVDDVKNADVYEVSTQLLQLQTRLQASYQVAGRLQELSLVNYI